MSTIVDVGGSLAIAAEDMFSTGVSTDLNVSFVSGAKLGETLTIVGSFGSVDVINEEKDGSYPVVIITTNRTRDATRWAGLSRTLQSR